MEISLISVGSSQILRLPQPSTDAARRFCSLRDTCTRGGADRSRQPPSLRRRAGSQAWGGALCGGGRLDAAALPVQMRWGRGARPKGSRVGAGRQRTIVSLSRLISYAVVA